MKILFICKKDVGRSQMASAFFNKLSKKNKSIDAGTSVGDEEGTRVNDLVIGCMKELGHDMAEKVQHQLTSKMVKWADKIIVLTEKENLPDYVDTKKVIFWKIEDAVDKSYEFHCKIRDEIKCRVENLVKEIEK
jgi:arsenate reductase (thioredoxin)